MILDYKVPFVPSENEYEVVYIREGERVVIPCRGSLENLNVTLHTVSHFSLDKLPLEEPGLEHESDVSAFLNLGDITVTETDSVFDLKRIRCSFWFP